MAHICSMDLVVRDAGSLFDGSAIHMAPVDGQRRLLLRDAGGSPRMFLSARSSSPSYDEGGAHVCGINFRGLVWQHAAGPPHFDSFCLSVGNVVELAGDDGSMAQLVARKSFPLAAMEIIAQAVGTG